MRRDQPVPNHITDEEIATTGLATARPAGVPPTTSEENNTSLEKARLLRRITPEPSGCWRWKGAHTADGYPFASVGGRTVRVYRFLYELKHGPIAPGLECDHICRNRWCANPSHIEPVTHLENMRRGGMARRVACAHGHVYTPRTMRLVRKGERETRICLICRRARQRAKNHEMREHAWALRRRIAAENPQSKGAP